MFESVPFWVKLEFDFGMPVEIGLARFLGGGRLCYRLSRTYWLFCQVHWGT